MADQNLTPEQLLQLIACGRASLAARIRLKQAKIDSL
jgi:hypothetical protein